MEQFLKLTVRVVYIGVFGIAALSVFIPICINIYLDLKQVDVYLLAATAYQEITNKFLIPLLDYLQMITVQIVFRCIVSIIVLSIATKTMFRDIFRVLLLEPQPSIGSGGVWLIFFYIMYCFVYVWHEYIITGKVQFGDQLQVVVGSSVIYLVIVIGIWAFFK